MRNLAVLAMALVTAGPLVGQDGTSIFTLLDVSDRTIAADEEVTGQLTEGDYIASGRRVQAWALAAEPGAALQLDVISEDFDPVLYVAGPDLGERSDDDGGEGTNSRLCIEFPGEGLYRLVAASYGGDTGRYQVRTRARSSCAETAAGGSEITDLRTLDTGGRTLSADAEAEGSLTSVDPTMFGSHVQAWTIEGRAGETLTIDLVSDAFDAYLTVLGPGLSNWLTNDDGAGLCNSRVTIDFPETGSYRVVASSVSGNAGPFTLRTYRDPPPPVDGGCVPPSRSGGSGDQVDAVEDVLVEGAVRMGGTVSGRLAASLGTYQGRPAQRWTFEGREGQQVAIDHVSSDFDAFLYLQGPGFETPIYNDDGGDGLNSRLCVTIPATATYDIVAAALSSGSEGAYELSLTDDPEEGGCGAFRFSISLGLGGLPLEPRRLQAGDEVQGRLDPETDERHPGDGSLVDVWAVEAEAGERIVVDLISDEFDAFLYLLGPGFDGPQTDDDGGGRCHSRIEVVAPLGGTYRAVANALTEGTYGDYTLRVSSEAGPVMDGGCLGPTSSAPTTSSADVSTFLGVLAESSRSLPLGSEVAGELTADDPVLEDGSHAQSWGVDVEAGERVIVELLSDDFDTFLYVIPPEGAVLEDDDGLSGTNSGLTFTAAIAGTYHVIVNSFSGSATGRYRLRAIRQVEGDG